MYEQKFIHAVPSLVVISIADKQTLTSFPFDDQYNIWMCVEQEVIMRLTMPGTMQLYKV